MRAKEMLSMLRWHPDHKEKEYMIVYIHRGAPHDERSIRLSEIEAFYTSDFLIMRADGMESYIPFHRMKRIEDSSGNVIWEKRAII